MCKVSKRVIIEQIFERNTTIMLVCICWFMHMQETQKNNCKLLQLTNNKKINNKTRRKDNEDTLLFSLILIAYLFSFFHLLFCTKS